MNLGWYLHRLKAMTPSEVMHRLSERLKHRSDASFADVVRRLSLGEVVDVLSLPDPGKASDLLRQSLAQDAAALIRGEWQLFGWREVQVGTPPNWHRDSAAGVCIPSSSLSHRMNHRTLPEGADVRTIWEVNRWSELVRLAMHAWVNGDVHAIRTSLDWLKDWCDRNPVAFGINWTSPLEAGLRLINFTWFDTLVQSSLGELQRIDPGLSATLDALKQTQRTLAARVVPAHAAWVWRYRSYGSSANNHLLGELVGLLHAVKRWPALESCTATAESLWQEISQCILQQFATDGGNKEQALHYHLFAWEMAWHAAHLMGKKDGPVMERLFQAAEFFTQVSHEGEQWEYGDNDDAQILPLTHHRIHGVEEWRAWMRGEPAGQFIRYWMPSPPSLQNSSPDWIASESGMAMATDGAWKVRLDASPLGFGSMAAHGHGDALHVSLWDGPLALVIDPGTGGYFGMKEERTLLAAWSSHNGPQPASGFQTPRRMGTFLWSSHHQDPVLKRAAPAAFQASLAHEALHFTRMVQLHPQGSVVISDTLAERGSFRVRWHLAPECMVTPDEASPLRFHITRDQRSWYVEFHGTQLSCSISESIASRRYGQFEPCFVLEIIASETMTAVWSRA